MKKVLFVIPTMRMGGAEQSLVSLLNMLDTTKYEIDLLLFEKKGELLENISPAIRIYETDLVTRAMVLEFRYYFKELIKAGKLWAAVVRLFILFMSKLQGLLNRNLVLSWEISKNLIQPIEKKYDVAVGYLEGVADFYVVDKVNAKRKIGWIHNDFSKQKRNHQAEKKYYESFDKIAIISDICKEHFLNYYPQLVSKTLIIENMSNYPRILEQASKVFSEQIEQSTSYIVSIGRLEEAKGFDMAILAAAQLKTKGIKFVWHVFGDGSLKDKLQTLIRENGLEKQFVLKGITKNPYVYMRNADILVQSSRYEGKSIVLDEAKFLGKPIVVTNYPSAKDQIEDQETGIIVDMEAAAIAEGIELLIKNADLRNRIAENCKNSHIVDPIPLKQVEKLLDER